MKKILLALAACAVSATALAQPMPPRGPHADRGHPHVAHRRVKHKVWVPAHREHGRLVRGHYVWR
jgi:Ni/Co efflux regulator RcnB